ncbi:MAG: family 20 glycosylhydrolase [Bacteroidales bacterium]|nr:family 20 glycosylhydrolase [Bacteroidales bacterium]MCF8390609.1 family 20 glycosylhydrolase [Bacteroidales bacterium]
MNQLTITFRQLIFLLTGIFFLTTTSFSQAPQLSEKSINDFQVKGFHLDLRIQIMKPEALHNLAEELAGFGMNTLIMEYEASFPYESHPLIPNRYAYSKNEIRSFISFCDSLGIDVIPMQQSFGHVEYILRNYKYAELREDQKEISQVCPLEYDLNKKLFTDLFTEMAAEHPSEYFHIGGDETYLLGHCDECKEFVEENGKSNLYINHIKMLCDIVIDLGKRPVLWADIALKYPEAIGNLPKETVFIDWNYGWKLNHFGDVEKLGASQYEVWGAPSLRSSPDNYFLSLWDKHLKNFHDFIPAGRSLGYSGMILTSWSTSGQYSTLFEARSKIIDLSPIRIVYPLTAFRILIAAYAEAIIIENPLDINSFLIDYCNERFGFNKKQTKEFWSALTTTPNELLNGNVYNENTLNIAMMLDSTRKAVKTLKKFKPVQNNAEYEHFILMMEMRENYLHFNELERRANSDDFKSVQLPQLLSELELVMEKAKRIDKKYILLNKDVYYTSELELENESRNLPVNLLYNRLNRIR